MAFGFLALSIGFSWEFGIFLYFLVACTRLYNPLCPSVGWSVTFNFFYDFISLISLLLPKWSSDLKYANMAPAHPHATSIAVYLALFKEIPPHLIFSGICQAKHVLFEYYTFSKKFHLFEFSQSPKYLRMGGQDDLETKCKVKLPDIRKRKRGQQLQVPNPSKT